MAKMHSMLRLHKAACELLPPDFVFLCYDGRGLAHRKKGEYDKAIADYSELIRLKPDLPGGYFDRGIAYEKKGDFDKAIVDLNEAIRLFPNWAFAYQIRGRVHAKKGEQPKAEEDFAQAKKLGYEGE